MNFSLKISSALQSQLFPGIKHLQGPSYDIGTRARVTELPGHVLLQDGGNTLFVYPDDHEASANTGLWRQDAETLGLDGTRHMRLLDSGETVFVYPEDGEFLPERDLWKRDARRAALIAGGGVEVFFEKGKEYFVYPSDLPENPQENDWLADAIAAGLIDDNE